MITGYNTDVEYAGRVYHVQTEDKGRRNPVIVSLVYSGGEILAMRRSSYSELANSDEFSEPGVVALMEVQHQNLVREIGNGKLDPEGPKPFGYELISNRSLDEVVLDYLSREIDMEAIRLELESPESFVAGQEATVGLRVMYEASDRPITGIRVGVTLTADAGPPRELFSGLTDPRGRVSTSVAIPRPSDGGTAFVVCRAEASGRTAEVRRPVCRPGECP